MQKLSEVIQRPKNMPESEPNTESKCPQCRGTGWLKVDGYHRFCECELGTFQKQKDEDDNGRFRKEYAENLLRIANIPLRYAFAHAIDFEEAFFVDLLKSIDFKQGKGLFLWGAVGSGKTHLAAAILNHGLDMHDGENTMMLPDGFGKRFLFVQVPDLLDKIRSSYEDRRSTGEDWLDQATDATLLALDDIGAERVTDWVREKLFQLVNRRYNAVKATIVTSNLSPDELSDRIGDRTVSRLVGMCRIVRLDGEDKRLQAK